MYVYEDVCIDRLALIYHSLTTCSENIFIHEDLYAPFYADFSQEKFEITKILGCFLLLKQARECHDHTKIK